MEKLSLLQTETTLQNNVCLEVIRQQKKLNPNYTENETFNACYTHLNNKFGVGGYAKFYFEDEEYENFLKEIRILLADKESFIKDHKKYIENLKKEGKI